MLRKILQAAAAVLVLLLAGFGVHKLTTVTLHDIAAFYDLGAPRSHLQVVSGDIYAIGPDNLTQEKICRMALQEQFVDRVRLDAKFSNGIVENIPFISGIIGDDKAEALTGIPRGTRLRFLGEFTHLREDAPQGAPAECEREMVDRMNRRQRICIVSSSLIPTDDVVFSAYRFNSLPIYVPESVFEAHGRVKSDAAKAAERHNCPLESDVPWDVAFRKALNVVQVEPFQQARAAPPSDG